MTCSKIHIVQALGQIGNDQAMAVLNDVLSTKSIFHKRALNKLKSAARYFLKRPSGKDAAGREKFTAKEGGIAK